MPKVHLPVRVEKKALERLKVLSKQDNRTLSGYVNNVLKKHIESKEEEKPKGAIDLLREWKNNK